MITNLTPHEIIVYKTADVLNQERVFPPSGHIARVQTESEIVASVDGIACHKTTFGDIEGLPEPEEGEYFLVSRMVKDRCPGRSDVIVPGELVRDANGKIVGCKGFSL